MYYRARVSTDFRSKDLPAILPQRPDTGQDILYTCMVTETRFVTTYYQPAQTGREGSQARPRSRFTRCRTASALTTRSSREVYTHVFCFRLVLCPSL